MKLVSQPKISSFLETVDMFPCAQNSAESTRTKDRKLRSGFEYSQLNYIEDLPDFADQIDDDSYIQSDDDLSSIIFSSDGESDLLIDPNNLHNSPSKKEYLEAVLSSIMSFGCLNLSQAEIVVNLFNSLNQRFSSDPICLPSIRYYWDKKSKENPVKCYILCDEKHAHGPFIGEPKDFGFFICGDQHVKGTIKNDQYFLHISLKKQLENHLPSFSENDYLEVNDDEEINDICSGYQAKKLKSDSSDTDSKKFSITLHADEVQAGNSSNIKIFPILITLNELKPDIRRKNIFMVGLFVGKTKPKVSSYLGPIADELKELENSPISWINKEGKQMRSTFHLICLIADAPMRAYLRNVRQYNFSHGCDWCLHQMSSIDGNRMYSNLTSRTEINNLKRKHDDFLEFSTLFNADSNSEDHDQQILNPRFKGLIDDSPLLGLKYFDLVNGISVEPMHCLLLGIVRSILLKGWLGSKNLKIYEVNDKTSFKDRLSERLIKIRVPTDFGRPPRDLDQVKHWKSAEYDSFLSYYFLPTIKGLLKPAIYNHFLCLVRIYFLAHRGPINSDRIEEITNLIEVFQHGVFKIYGSSFMTYNLHILTHLPNSLKNLGPTASVSSYPLENTMGILKEKVRRSVNIASSLVRVFINDFRFKESLITRISSWRLSEREKRCFGLSEGENTNHSPKITVTRNNEFVQGRNDKIRLIKEHLGSQYLTNDIEFLKSVTISGLRYSSESYTVGKKRDDSFINFRNQQFFRIMDIVRIKGEKIYGICRQIKVSKTKTQFKGPKEKVILNFDHIFDVKLEKLDQQILTLIELNSEIKKAIFIPSTEFSHKYRCDHIVEAFLLNF